MTKLTEDQLHILQHSLGLDKYGQGTFYRNRFVTGTESTDFEKCSYLCSQGLMEDRGPQEMMGGMHYFTVTVNGQKAVVTESPKPPKVSRGRQRYHDFLSADSGLTFIEWLTRQSKASRL